jgi:hypothetical protein
MRGWRKVIFAADCDEDGNCPVCAIDYGECECPGPTQEDEYDYTTIDGELYARKRSWRSRPVERVVEVDEGDRRLQRESHR